MQCYTPFFFTNEKYINMKKTEYNFYYENKTKGKYKIFGLLPSITICRDTQCLDDFGYSAWEFYFEWLWFQASFHIETENYKSKKNGT